jgi:4a-hydroxytetrahydrobiopterin dehydratase
MSELQQQTCTACRAEAPTVTREETVELKPHIPDWVIHREGVDRLRRVFPFENFLGAMAFAGKVGELAEKEGHHPALLVEWGRVTVSWWTHKIGGLHRNDFIMAAKTDGLYTP